MKRILFGAGALALCLWAADTAEDRWWAHVAYLADDKLEGRDTGSEGHRMAARYVAQEYERVGLKPAGTDGYFQPVRFRSHKIDEAGCSLELVFDGRTEKLALGEDAYFNVRMDLAPEIEVGMVFAGYGFAVAENGFDEFEGLDAKGKLVLYLTGGPKDMPGPLMSHSQSAAERWKRARAAGAAGLASISNPAASDIPWDRAKLSRFLPAMRLTEMASDSEGSKIGLTLNPASMDKLLAGTGHTMAGIAKAAADGKRLPRFPLKAKLRAKTRLVTADVESQNVVGRAEGSDPVLKREHVVLSAHLDHVGVGRPIAGDAIYNGAMDNASGIASLIEIAGMMRGKALKRSVLFVAVTGEEKGLLGSRYFAGAPTVAAESMVADLNFDMFLPLFPLTKVIAYGMDESTLGEAIRKVAGDAGVEVIPDPEPQRNSFIRSDQYSFIKAGVPALAFKLGYAKGSAEEALFKGWLKDRYHAPSDDLQQPVDRGAAVRFNRLMAALAEHVANDGARPEWNRKSFFRRFAR
jgi:Zn-dependent M28 family amino/carboxypeptidase